MLAHGFIIPMIKMERFEFVFGNFVSEDRKNK